MQKPYSAKFLRRFLCSTISFCVTAVPREDKLKSLGIIDDRLFIQSLTQRQESLVTIINIGNRREVERFRCRDNKRQRSVESGRTYGKRALTYQVESYYKGIISCWRYFFHNPRYDLYQVTIGYDRHIRVAHRCHCAPRQSDSLTRPVELDSETCGQPARHETHLGSGVPHRVNPCGHNLPFP